MSIPNHTSFSELCIAAGVAYTGWQKTAETDKIVNLLYDQMDNKSSNLTKTMRALALRDYSVTKLLATTLQFSGAPSTVRVPVLSYTYNNALVENDQGQYGLCGRFSRVFNTVTNEMTYTGVPSQTDITADWLNNLILNMQDSKNLTIAPAVSPISMYSIAGGPVIENTGQNIQIPSGTVVTMTTAGVGFTSNIWYGGEAPIAGETHTCTIDVNGTVEIANLYFNVHGETISPSFHFVVV